jgi:hypothetical protein
MENNPNQRTRGQNIMGGCLAMGTQDGGEDLYCMFSSGWGHQSKEVAAFHAMFHPYYDVFKLEN